MKPGEIYLVDCGMKAKVRPAIMVSRQDDDPPRRLTVFVPVTTEYRGSGYEVKLGKSRPFRDESFANVQGIWAAEDVDVQRYLGKLEADTLKRLKTALAWCLELEPPST